MGNQMLEGATEENVLTALCYNADACVQIALRVPHTMFSSRGYRLIAEKAIDFVIKYKTPPGSHIRDELEEKLRPGSSEAMFFADTFASMERIKGEIHAEYVLDKLDAFIEKVTITQAIQKAADAAHEGNIEKARRYGIEFLAALPKDNTNLSDPWGQPMPPPFDTTMLPRVLRNFVEDRAEVTGADAAGFAWSAISACSAALDGSIRLRMKANDSWTVCPGIWVLLVGESSTKKTPILRTTWGPIDQIQSEATDTYQLKLAAWEKEEKDNRGPEPTFIRYKTDSATIEGLQGILSKQNRGIARYADEWPSIIGEMEKYSAGRGGASADRAFLLQSWNGGPYILDRVKAGRGTVIIDNNHVVICGGVQPDKLRAMNKDNALIQDGFLQRSAVIILAPATTGDDAYSASASAAYEELIRDLARIRGGYVASLAPDATEVRKRVEAALAPLLSNDALGAGFRTFVGKLMEFWGRLALVMEHVLERGEVDQVSKEAALIAEELVFDSLLKHAVVFYEWLGGGGDLETTRSVAGWILAHQKQRLVSSDIKSGVRALRDADTQTIIRALSPLVAGGWLSPDQEIYPKVWTVNPAVHSKFAERAILEKTQRDQIRALIPKRES